MVPCLKQKDFFEYFMDFKGPRGHETTFFLTFRPRTRRTDMRPAPWDSALFTDQKQALLEANRIFLNILLILRCEGPIRGLNLSSFDAFP